MTKHVSEQVQKAKEFAYKHHAGHMYGDRPYTAHLEEVVAKVKQHMGTFTKVAEYEDNAIILAYLHDVVEDTDVTVKDIATEFGKFVSYWVDLISDPEGPNRKTRKLLSWPRLRIYRIVKFVKLCDRICNTAGDKKLDMYRKEFPMFEAALYEKADDLDPLWEELRELTYRSA